MDRGLAQAIQQARLGKKMTQKQLATVRVQKREWGDVLRRVGGGGVGPRKKYRTGDARGEKNADISTFFRPYAIIRFFCRSP